MHWLVAGSRSSLQVHNFIHVLGAIYLAGNVCGIPIVIVSLTLTILQSLNDQCQSQTP